MKLKKDINTIKKLSREKDEENWGFRSFLKSGGIPRAKIDAIVQRLDKKISAQIDCKTCANCCKEIKPVLKQDDIANLAAGMNMSPEKLVKQYLVETDIDGEYHFNALPCPLLKNNLCSVYNFRPNDCRSFPHLHKKNFVSRSMSVVNNTSICPIVFNVYEELKSEIWEMDEFDDFY